MRETSVEAYIGLGTNLGDRRGHLEEALERVDALPATRVALVSSVYATEPRIVEDQPEFLNACAKIETRLPAGKLLDQLLDVEEAMGRRRERASDKGPRRIDLDLLLYGDESRDEPGLSVPHPGLPERAFVLEPLADIAADVVHPDLGRTVAELREACADTGEVRRVDGA